MMQRELYDGQESVKRRGGDTALAKPTLLRTFCYARALCYIRSVKYGDIELGQETRACLLHNNSRRT